MNSTSIGRIQEVKHKNKKKYSVFLFDGLDHALFNNIEDAIKYFKYHVLAIFNYEDFNFLHIQYLHLKDMVHYILFKKNTNGEIIVFEETRFDFLRTHPHKLHKYKLRKVINEKNYSFSDIFRVAINWHPLYSIWNLTLLILILIGSWLFLIYGLNFLNKSNENFSIVDKIILFTSFFASIFTIFFIVIIQYKTRFKLFQTSGDFKEINWRRWYIIRINQLVISIFTFLISLFVISFFMYKSFDIDDNFIIVLGINLLIWILHFITALSMLVYSQQRKQRVQKKYFTKWEIKLFRKWAWRSEGEEIVKVNDIFIFNDQYSDSLTRQAIEETTAVLNKTNNEYLKKMRKNRLAKRKIMIESYKKHFKGVSNDNISKNNQ